VDTGTIIDGVAGMEVATWEDDSPGTGTRRLGPTAEDFHDVVDVGGSDSATSRSGRERLLVAVQFRLQLSVLGDALGVGVVLVDRLVV